MTKAEQKRIADATSFIHANLKRVSAQMKNNLLEAVGDWAVSSIELKLNQVITGERKANGCTKESLIEMIEKQLTKKTTISFEAMKEEEKNFDSKIENVASKMVSFGLTNVHFRIQELKAKHGTFEFLANNDKFEVYARAIWVEGDIKAPHFRFITTKREFKK